MKKSLFSLIGALLFLSVICGQETNIYVSQFRGSDANNGESWQTPYKSLGAAFQKIGTNAGTYIINVAQGYYMLNGLPTSEKKIIELGNNQEITLQGGFSTPIDGVSDQNDSYTTALDTYDPGISGAWTSFWLRNNAKLHLKNINIVNARQGGEYKGALATIDKTNGGAFTMDKVDVNEWNGGNLRAAGLIAVFEAVDTDIKVTNSLIERISNRNGRGQFIVTKNDRSKNLRIEVDKTTFRHVRKTGTDVSLFMLSFNKNYDTEAGSYLKITNSEFLNNKRGRAAAQSAAILTSNNLPVITLENNKVYGNTGGVAGAFEIGNALTITSTNNLYQDNYGGQAGGVFWIHGWYDDNLESEFNITGDRFIGNQAGMDGFSGKGGAIHISRSIVSESTAIVSMKLHIKDSYFTDNKSLYNAGGALFLRTDRDAIIENSVFCGNQANVNFGTTTGVGGAIAAYGPGELNINSTVFRNNKAPYRGGAIFGAKDKFVMDSDLVASKRTYLEGNTAQDGGGIFFEGNSAIDIKNTTFIKNSASRDGGAVSFYGLGNIFPTVVKTTFKENNAGRRGGAYYAYNISGEVKTEESLFYQNTASPDGGNGTGGGAVSSFNANLTFEQSIFDRNNTKGWGGAIYYTDGARLVKLVSSKLIANKATNGGGIYITSAGGAHIQSTATQFYKNKATEVAGSLYMVASGYNTSEIRDSRFIENTAANTAGNIFLNQTLAGPSIIDLIDNTKFWGNTIAGKEVENADLYRNNFTAIIYAITNSGLQFNLDSYHSRYNIDKNTSYVQQTALGPVTYIPETVNYIIPDCAMRVDTPLSPLISSSQNIPFDGMPDNIPETKVDVNGYERAPFGVFTQVGLQNAESCELNPAVIAFSARSNNPITRVQESEVSEAIESILPVPIPDLKFTYEMVKIDSYTNRKTVEEFVLTRDDSRVDIKVVDTAENVYQSVSEGSEVRDLYFIYMFDFSDKLVPGYTYTFYITRIEHVDAPTAGGPYIYDDNSYKTTLVTPECKTCVVKPEDGMPAVTKVGISTLNRNTDSWLSDDAQNRLGAYIALESTEKGFVLPRLTTEQIGNIGKDNGSSVEEGMLVWDTKENCLKMFYDKNNEGVLGWYCLTNDCSR
ncbi:MAG: hypothetical protein ACR2MS_09215 [Weeksellaceae bacterium]